MSAIERDDGVQFVLYTYRDTLFATKASIFRQDVVELQKESGDYVRFFELGGGKVDVIINNEPGFLLAECVSSYFENPYNMIFCEQLAGQESAVLIVVKDGAIYLDAMLPTSLLIDEFISLSTIEDTKFDIYAYGEIPLGAVSSDENFAFPAEMVRSFKWLDAPLVPRVDPDPAFQLLSIEDALQELSFAKSKTPQMIIGLIIVVAIGFFAYELLKPKEVVAPVQAPPKPVYVDPYLSYKATLATPSPQELIKKFDVEVRKFMTIPGWEVTNVSMKDQKIQAALKLSGGSADILLIWLKQTDVELQVSGGKATITKSMHVQNRASPTKIFDSKDMVATIYDRLRIVVDSNNIKIGNTTSNDNYMQTEMSVNITNVTPAIVDFIGKEFARLPIILGDVKFSVNQGMMSGSIDFTVVGAPEK